MKNEHKIMAAIRQSGSMCDDCLSEASGVKPRQTVNIFCRSAVVNQVLRRSKDRCRQCGASKLINHLLDGSPPTISADPALRQSSHELDADRDWFWEGNVQSRIVEQLVRDGWQITAVADTGSRAPGKDVVAQQDGHLMWVSVKGWPLKSPNVQARHWFAGALFDMLTYRNENADPKLVVALPDGFSTYQNLISRMTWAVRNVDFEFWFVAENGGVRKVTAEDLS